MIEVNLTEKEFEELKRIFKLKYDGLSDQNIDADYADILDGINASFETAGRPLNYTSENKPRIKNGN